MIKGAKRDHFAIDIKQGAMNVHFSDGQGGIKYFTSWEPGFQIRYFLRNSVKSSNAKLTFVVTVKSITKVEV